ncbi:helix-turn-helix domain-containing protein [Emticicia sp. TH156]|uniref:helix-turn-helix domain-containing protein n=1 Tax=Emticicia sp. TH156 TaxID=2067454 RepID=UPI000C75ECC9|nr:helix-turn-helix domain-containing protein [Emticicia sp. TH156]PLK43954.1 AraC family transcriptional regulator [Emticicia sp. TH156]
MSDKSKSIPLKYLAKKFDKGIAVGKLPFDDLQLSEEAEHSHRHDFHFFILQKNGTLDFEIDFEKYNIKKPSVFYVAPNQVHRVLRAEKINYYVLAISNENLNTEYMKLLQEISPAKPLTLNTKDFSLLSKAVLLCNELFEKKNNILYLPLLKDSCNTLVGLIISQYLENTKQTDTLSRFEITTKAFTLALEKDFVKNKRPSQYAQQLNISVPYLNECVKKATGLSVTFHVQQRIILEAKRLLYHSSKSVKEISAELGYEDYAYFSRLFTKVTGMTALAFRNKNHD